MHQWGILNTLLQNLKFVSLKLATGGDNVDKDANDDNRQQQIIHDCFDKCQTNQKLPKLEVMFWLIGYSLFFKNNVVVTVMGIVCKQ